MWYLKDSKWPWLLSPLSALYRGIVYLRKRLYTLVPTPPYSVPVLVIGNITVGGVGKTPLVLFTLEYLKKIGLRPGVVSRGYGGYADSYPFNVEASSYALECGDEPLMIRQKSLCPVVVDPDRDRAVNYLLKHHDCDVVVSDDGLQHYNMHRDVEIVVMGAERGVGNGFCLPAGPLREPIERLQEADLVIWNGTQSQKVWMKTYISTWINLRNGERVEPDAFKDQRVHAVAGLGNPDKFFKAVNGLGAQCVEHPFADHYGYIEGSLDFEEDLPILMTEKDAVKCRSFATDAMWFAKLETEVSETYTEFLDAKFSRS